MLLLRGPEAMIVYVLVSWILGITDPVISAFDTAQAICAEDAKMREEFPRYRAKIYKITTPSDQEVINAIVAHQPDPKTVVREGKCEPKREFTFLPEKPL